LRAWPYIVDPTGTKLSVTFGIQARIYGTTVTMEDDLMAFSKLIREAIATLPILYPLLTAEILPEQTPECCEGTDANYNEEYIEVKVSVA
jgi:hypothetical protein